MRQQVPETESEAGEFVKVAEVEDILAGQGRLVEMAGMRIAIFNSHGAFYATESHCLYCNGSLLEAQLVGTEILCPSDGAAFYLPTGESVWPEADKKRLATYRVRVDGREVQIKGGVQADKETGHLLLYYKNKGGNASSPVPFSRLTPGWRAETEFPK